MEKSTQIKIVIIHNTRLFEGLEYGPGNSLFNFLKTVCRDETLQIQNIDLKTFTNPEENTIYLNCHNQKIPNDWSKNDHVIDVVVIPENIKTDPNSFGDVPALARKPDNKYEANQALLSILRNALNKNETNTNSISPKEKVGGKVGGKEKVEVKVKVPVRSGGGGKSRVPVGSGGKEKEKVGSKGRTGTKIGGGVEVEVKVPVEVEVPVGSGGKVPVKVEVEIPVEVEAQVISHVTKFVDALVSYVTTDASYTDAKTAFLTAINATALAAQDGSGVKAAVDALEQYVNAEATKLKPATNKLTSKHVEAVLRSKITKLVLAIAAAASVVFGVTVQVLDKVEKLIKDGTIAKTLKLEDLLKFIKDQQGKSFMYDKHTISAVCLVITVLCAAGLYKGFTTKPGVTEEAPTVDAGRIKDLIRDIEEAVTPQAVEIQ